MKQQYTIENLSCASCAKKMEDKIQKHEGVHQASINFTTKKLHINMHERIRIKEIEEIARSVERDVHLIPVGEQADQNKSILPRLIVALGLFIIALLMSNELYKKVLLILSYLLIGGDVLYKAIRNMIRGELFDENFLMGIATLGAFAINEFPEAAAVMIFYQTGEYFQEIH